MSLFPNVLPASRGDLAILLAATALVILSIGVTIVAGSTMQKGAILRAALALCIDVVIFHAVFDATTAAVVKREPVSFLGGFLRDLNYSTELGLTLMLLSFALYRIYAVLRLRDHSITYFSVGEALDDLPLGVMFAGKSGQVLQTNTAMEERNREITKEPLTNAEAFWETIVHGERNEGIAVEGTEQPVVKMPDGTTWIFSRQKCQSTIGEFYQILASNATEEQMLHNEIDKNVQRLAHMNRRLREYNDIVDETIRKEELLATKKRVHDEMGTTLLAARTLILNEESPVTAEQVYQQWKEDVKLVRREAQREALREDPGEQFRQAAAYLGVDLQIRGRFPEDPAATNLVCTGIQECLTNAIQHAKATEMYVTIEETAGEYLATYSNNGVQVQHPFREGGGLTLLRSEAEAGGATMEYLPGEQFRLQLRIPKLK